MSAPRVMVIRVDLPMPINFLPCQMLWSCNVRPATPINHIVCAIHWNNGATGPLSWLFVHLTILWYVCACGLFQLDKVRRPGERNLLLAWRAFPWIPLTLQSSFYPSMKVQKRKAAHSQTLASEVDTVCLLPPPLLCFLVVVMLHEVKE